MEYSGTLLSSNELDGIVVVEESRVDKLREGTLELQLLDDSDIRVNACDHVVLYVRSLALLEMLYLWKCTS
jgi:hypothetical protein